MSITVFPVSCRVGTVMFSVLGLASAQEVRIPQRPRDPWSLMQQGRYLPGLALAEQDHAKGNNPMAADTLAVLRAASGDYAGAKEAMGEATEPGDRPPPDPSPLSGLEQVNALQAIVEEARTRRIVILNEAHHVPETRHLTLAVARALWEQGYRYLACEAFAPTITGYAKAGYPSRDNCWGYLCEPVFADLVRQAGKLGYRFVHYEVETPGPQGDTTDQINHRESEQCRNLIERIFEQDPEAKVLIHCGYSHATENWQELPDGRELGWMAARLKRELGHDPLTVDQTRQRAGAGPGAGPPVWRSAVAGGRLTEASVFRKGDGTYFVEGNSWAGRVDLQVFHPDTESEDGRPTWLAMGGYRQPVEIPAELEPLEGRVLIQAFVAGEGEDAVPMDQVIWYADDVSPVLVLPAGEYRVLAQDESGAEVGRAECVSD